MSVQAYTGSTYAGSTRTTDGSGQAVFQLPSGSYRFKVVVNGTSYWSGPSNTCTFLSCIADAITIPASVTVTVRNAGGVAQVGMSVTPYTGTTFVGPTRTTDGSGQVIFPLMPGSYRFKVVVNGTSYWSGASNTCILPGCNTDAVTVPVSLPVTVRNANGVAQIGVTVQAFSGSTSVGSTRTTDGSGQVIFQLPAGSYRFKTVVNGTSFWSGTSNTCILPACTSDSITVPASVTVTVRNAAGVAQSGLKVSIYNMTAFAGSTKTTNGSGQAVFQVFPGNYRFKAVVNGVSYWSGTSNTCILPGCSSDTVSVPAPVTVTVKNANGVGQVGATVSLYNLTTFAGSTRTTNGSAQAVFQLLPGSYRFKTVVNGVSYWSGTSNTCTLPECNSDTVTVPSPVTVTVRDFNGIAQSGLTVSLYNGTSFMSLNKTTNGSGQAVFQLLTGSYGSGWS